MTAKAERILVKRSVVLVEVVLVMMLVVAVVAVGICMKETVAVLGHQW
jgi:hypothetical protein